MPGPGDAADQLRSLGRDLRHAGTQGKGLRKEMLKQARLATKPVGPEVKAEILATFPSEGGLNVWMASRLRMATKTKLTGRGVGVRMVFKRPNPNAAGGQADLSAANRGRIRHKTWGHMPWTTQEVRGGFVDRVLDGPLGDRARKGLLAAVEHTRRKIARH